MPALLEQIAHAFLIGAARGPDLEPVHRQGFTNQARDGKFRKITVQLVNPTTNEPLKVMDEKNKPIKYQIVAKAGYKAPLPVE